jgi:hypothetical protein
MFLLGFLLFLAGPAISAALIFAEKLITPWYLPALATLGVLCMAFSVWQRPGILRTIGLVLFLALCGFEWFFVAHAIRTPEYTGPAQAGKKLPAFTAAKADGTVFSSSDLAAGTPSIALFFRGHW